MSLDWLKTVFGAPKVALKNCLMTIAGCCIIGMAIYTFYVPANIQMGGFTGLALALKNAVHTDIPIGTITIVLNVFLLLVAAYFLNKRFLLLTVIGMLLAGVLINIMKPYGEALAQYIYPGGVPESDYFLLAFFGGILFGGGVGLVLRAGYATGGSDVLAFLLRLLFKSMSISTLIWLIDFSVILVGAYFAGSGYSALRIVMYSVVALFVTSKAIDMVLTGYNFKRVAFIISCENKKIAHEIMHSMKRGVTGLKALGHYRNTDIEVLMVVLNIKQVPILKTLVERIDEKAFIFVIDSREVSGEGFAKSNF